ncbi:peptidylprolyl isomerase [Anaerococcus senegalensis]|uniref:peptidylprolyl isomerase n=1 Tax=Anaerococcus senegalensis TaxID=1288120 RepID=UPI0002DF2E56|nr:peptidylprolyl isomerase [Anaerococcus senegalensis]
MNKKIIALVLATSFLFSACANDKAKDKKENGSNETQTSESAKEENLPDDAVAIVGGDKITKDSYKDEMSFYSAMLASQQQLKPSIVQMLVQDKLIADDMKKNNVKVDDKELDDKFLQYIQQFGGQEKFDKMLEDYNMSSDKFKETIKKDQIYQKHRDWFEKKHPVSDKDAKKYFDQHKETLAQVKASHILVADENTANEVKKKIDDGADFAELAKEYSKDTANSNKGGDLGYFTKDKMVKEFADKAFSMKKGEVSEPVKTSYGYHIIKVDDKKDTADSLKDDISKALNDKKYSDYLTKLFNKANVVTEDGPQKKDPKKDTKTTEPINNESSNTKENTNSNN